MNKRPMITEQQKDDIYDSLCYFYTSTRFNKTNLKLHFNRDCNNKEDFEKILFKENTRIFFRYAITLKGKDFLNCIKNEYNLFCIYNEVSNDAKQNWLNHTYNFIVPINGLSGYINKIDTISFVKWYNKKTKESQPIQTPQQFKDKLTKENISNTQNKLIPNVSINEVYDFFKVLIDKPNRKGKFYLSEQKLLIFIKATFIDEKPIKQKFDVAFSKDKIDVRSVFNRFQNYCYDLEYNKTYVKDKYFKIMFEAFEGFNQKTDFNKWYKTNNKLPTLKRQKAK